MTFITKVRSVLDRVIPPISAVLFLICVAATCYGTINRTLGLSLNASWVEELSIYSMIWATVLLIGTLLRKGMHTQFTLLIEKLHGKVLSVWKIVIILVEAAIFVILLVGGTQLAENGANLVMSSMPIAMTWAYLCVPIGSALVLLEVIMILIEECINFRK